MGCGRGRVNEEGSGYREEGRGVIPKLTDRHTPLGTHAMPGMSVSYSINYKLYKLLTLMHVKFCFLFFPFPLFFFATVI